MAIVKVLLHSQKEKIICYTKRNKTCGVFRTWGIDLKKKEWIHIAWSKSGVSCFGR